MTWRRVFAECLEPDALVEPEGDDLVLPGGDGTSLRVIGWSDGQAAIRIQADPGSGGVGHLTGIPPGRWQKRADYILFENVEGSDYAVILEMKKSLRIRERKPYWQVRATRPIVAYLESLAWNVDSRVGRVVLRHVVVGRESGDRIPKQAPRARPRSLGCRWRVAGIEGVRFIAEELPLTWLVADPRQWDDCLEDDRQ